mgnify:CR=1 FL=1
MTVRIEWWMIPVALFGLACWARWKQESADDRHGVAVLFLPWIPLMVLADIVETFRNSFTQKREGEE